MSLLVGCLGILAIPVTWGILIAMAGLVWGTVLTLGVVGGGLFFIGQNVQSGSSETAEMLAAIPYVGPILARFISPITYYAIDSRIMFEETVHGTVLKVVDGLLAAKGAKALTPDERKLMAKDPLR